MKSILVILLLVLCLQNCSQNDDALKEVVKPVPLETPPETTTNTKELPEPPPPPPSGLSRLPLEEPLIKPNLSDADNKLIAAVQNENFDEAKNALEVGANPNLFYKTPNSLQSFYQTILGLAVEKKNTKIAELLLERGADANKALIDGYHASAGSNLTTAIAQRDFQMIKLLVKHKADVKEATGNVLTSTMNDLRDIKILRFLMKHGADIDSANVVGDTILINAIVEKDLKRLKVVLKYKPQLNKKREIIYANYELLSPLEVAMKYGNKEIVKELRKAGAKS